MTAPLSWDVCDRIVRAVASSSSIRRAAERFVANGGICASACAYALLGGVVRRVPAGARVGIHKFYAVEGASGRRNLAHERAVGTVATALLRNYVASMGANPALVALAASVNPATVRFLSAAELRRYRVVTGTAPETMSARSGASARRH